MGNPKPICVDFKGLRHVLACLCAVAYLIGLIACGGKGEEDPPPPMAPIITSFTAAKSPITSGASTTLTAVFSNGTGSVDHGIGVISSHVAKSTGILSANATFTLTVQGAGGTVTRTLTVAVAPEPVQPVITTPSTLSAGSGGSASVPDQADVTFQWSITGGTFSGGSTTSTGTNVTFTAGAAGTLNLTCAATNAAGDVSASGTGEITLVALPAITSFMAANPAVPAGGSTTLMAIFLGGTGSVDHDLGTVTSGEAVSTGTIASSITFTLTVTNAAGDTATTQTTVSTLPVGSVITFTTEGATFEPVVVVEGSPTILWTFGDGTTSTSGTPSKVYGSAATRTSNLQVTPWSALRRINIGFDGGDGGSNDIEHVADQSVSAVQGLEVVAPTLAQWCSSYNGIPSLDFSNFTNLDTIECFLSTSLVSVNLTNTPKLARACFEDCNLASLDLSQSPHLADLRGAMNAYPTIQFGTETFPDTWHICIRDNPQFTTRTMFASTARFPNLSELFIWNDNQIGTLGIPSTRPNAAAISILASGNHYTSLDLAGALQDAAGFGSIDLSNNQLSHVNLTGCVQLGQLNVQNNALSSSEGDAILATLDSLGRTWASAWDPSSSLMVDLRGNAVPSTAGRTSAQNLAGKGWTVYTDTWTEVPPPPPSTGEVRIDFTTQGDTTSMLCDYVRSPVVTWHWSDGTTSAGSPGGTATKSGLGSGTHPHYLTVSNGATLSRFGAASGGSQGHLISVSGLNGCPQLQVLYLYAEGLLTSIDRTDATQLREYHLLGTALTAINLDQVFADAVASGVRNGTIWANNGGSAASDSNRATLLGRGWVLNF